MATNLVACVVNPARKRSEPAWNLVRQHCDALGIAAPLRFDTTIEHPGELQAHQAIEANADIVIVIGGDGTVRNVSNVLSHTGVAMGVVPAGTANIFHLNAIGKQRSLDRSVRTALLGTPEPMDTGKVTLHLDDGLEIQQRFLAVVGAGYDAESLAGISESLKRRYGPLAYFVVGARQLRRNPHSFDVHLDGNRQESLPAWSVLVGNCGRVPGGITVLPGADLQDGLLNTLVLAPRSIASWAPIAWRAWRGKSHALGVVSDDTAREVTIIPEQPVSVQIDGDVHLNVHRLDIEIDPGSLLINTKREGTHENN